MTVYLFAGIAVTDYATALDWYEKLLGSPPSFFPHDTEAVWQLAEHGSVYIVQQPDHAGHAMHTIIVDDLDTVMAEIAQRGLKPAKEETYDNGVRKTTYADPDGNEIGFGGIPADPELAGQDLTSIVRDWAPVFLGSRTVRTPSPSCASIWSASASAGTVVR